MRGEYGREEDTPEYSALDSEQRLGIERDEFSEPEDAELEQANVEPEPEDGGSEGDAELEQANVEPEPEDGGSEGDAEPEPEPEDDWEHQDVAEP
ncbi:MAG: hypothetical protein ACRC0L_07215, partial [Angustibacter sp.]